MKFAVRYITIIGGVLILAGLFGIFDYFARDLDPQIGMTQIFRLLTGGVFIVGGIALGRLDDSKENKDV